MAKLNLIDKTKSDIDYTISTFPDGEVQICLGKLDRKDDVTIHCRVRNANELFLLLQVGDILDRQGISYHIEIYYLFTMRMDRVMDFNKPFSLDITMNLLGTLKRCLWINIAAPHNQEVVTFYNKVGFHEGILENIEELENSFICYPDKGAEDRYEWVHIIKQEVSKYLTCAKHRSEKTGFIDSFIVENPEAYTGGKVIVVDDLCDGGATFMLVAKALDALKVESKELWVTHAIQLDGIKKVAQVYDTVVLSNSYKDWGAENLPENVKVINILP